MIQRVSCDWLWLDGGVIVDAKDFIQILTQKMIFVIEFNLQTNIHQDSSAGVECNLVLNGEI